MLADARERCHRSGRIVVTRGEKVASPIVSTLRNKPKFDFLWGLSVSVGRLSYVDHSGHHDEYIENKMRI